MYIMGTIDSDSNSNDECSIAFIVRRLLTVVLKALRYEQIDKNSSDKCDASSWPTRGVVYMRHWDSG